MLMTLPSRSLSDLIQQHKKYIELTHHHPLGLPYSERISHIYPPGNIDMLSTVYGQLYQRLLKDLKGQQGKFSHQSPSEDY